MHGPHDVGQLFPNKKGFGSRIGSPFHIELLPGRHILTVGYCEEGMTVGGQFAEYSASPQTLEFEAKAGRTYTIEAEVWDDKWKAKVVEIKIDREPQGREIGIFHHSCGLPKEWPQKAL